LAWQRTVRRRARADHFEVGNAALRRVEAKLCTEGKAGFAKKQWPAAVIASHNHP
jgi:hypothetical protein